jgi:DNA polymerase-1
VSGDPATLKTRLLSSSVLTTITCLRVVFIDSEFDARKDRGERPGFPICICAIETDAASNVIEYRLKAPYPPRAPWDRGDPYLAVVFAGSAEGGSFLNVGWEFPKLIIDLYAEYLTIHNTEMSKGEGGKIPIGLIGACRRYRVAGMDKAVKEDMRALAYTKTDHTPEEIEALQDYCLHNDVGMLMRLYLVMRPYIDMLRAPIRGAYMMEIERIRWRGIPIDMEKYRLAEQQGPVVASKMRRELNRKLGAEIYYCGVFKRKVMFQVMRRNNISIPIDPKTGKPSVATKLLKSMIDTYPIIKIFYEDKRMIDALQNLKLEIGADGRNRFWLNPFGTKTGRNNPSTNRAIFGLPHTMRSFIKPGPGMAIAQVDFSTEEIGIAAFLSGDPQLIADYQNGDVYRQFAANSLGIQNPTEQQRQTYKGIVLGRIYGKGAASLARDLGISKSQAVAILDEMRARYPVLEAWLQRVTTKAAHCIPITCTLGWSLTAVGKPGEERTFLNFPMQGNGGELLRLVIIRASHLPIIGCAHDSFMVEAPIDQIEVVVAELQAIMRQISRDLFGFELRADCKPHDIIRYPGRFIDKREREDKMQHWNWLMQLVTEGVHGSTDRGPGDPAAHDEETQARAKAV